MREIDLLPFTDGIVSREKGLEIAIPMMYSAKTIPGQNSKLSSFVESGADSPAIITSPFAISGEDATLAFNLYLPELDDLTLFQPAEPNESRLILKPSPSISAVENSGQLNSLSSNTADGQVQKKYDYLLARFEIWGVIKNDLNPTCVSGRVEGYWMKLDLLGWLLGSINRWKTYAEGSLGSIVDQPGQYQFYWTKPKICSTGTSNRDAIYNGLLKMLKDLVSDVAGAIGKRLDDLLKASPTVAAFLADTLVKLISTTSPGTFGLSVNPTSNSVKRGQSVEFDVHVEAHNGFAGRVSLTAGGKTGSTVSFSPQVVVGEGHSRFSVRPSKTSPLGPGQLTIQATGGSLRQEVSISINIQP